MCYMANCYTLRSPDMLKPLLGRAALFVGAAVSLFALTWLLTADQKLPHAFSRIFLPFVIVVAAVSLLLLWSTIVGLLSRTRLWSPQWTFLVAGLPFYILGIWVFFFSRLEMRPLGYVRMLTMVAFGSLSGHRARKKAYPQFCDKDSPSAPLPPPTLFPK